MEIIGAIKMIEETKTYGASGFRKREFVVTTDEQYPQMILMNFVQDKCSLLDNYMVGQSVKVFINLRGREWINLEGEAKYFNEVQAWRMEPITSQSPQEQQPPEPIGNEPDGLPY